MILRWTPTAAHDLERIAAFVAQVNPDAAARVVQAIVQAIESLPSQPGKGRPVQQADTRELIIPSLGYLVRYRVANDAVHILRIWHGARDRPH